MGFRGFREKSESRTKVSSDNEPNVRDLLFAHAFETKIGFGSGLAPYMKTKPESAIRNSLLICTRMCFPGISERKSHDASNVYAQTLSSTFFRHWNGNTRKIISSILPIRTTPRLNH